MSQDPQGAQAPGPLAFMARNTVAANLLMLALILGGLVISTRLKQEVFPDFDLDTVIITVPYPGASPAEIETGIIASIEASIRGLDGIKEVVSVASEGSARVSAELLLGQAPNEVLNDIKNNVDRITSFPEDAERPTVSLATSRREVMDVFVHGDASEEVLRQVAESLRDRMLLQEHITLVEFSAARPREVAIEVTQDALRRFGLTLDGVARAVGAAAVELPGGSVKTRDGEILLRTDERRDLAREFAGIPIVSTSDGARVTLGDIAEIRDGFQEVDEAAFYNGRPAVRVRVFRVGDQTPIQVADATRAAIARFEGELPPGIGVDVWNDDSQSFRERIDLLLRNAAQGLVLVLVILGLFLDFRLAFWVTLGIPISFAGSFFVLPVVGVSLNMISLFAYIITLGMVVDDAIVVGENIFERRQGGEGALSAAIAGVREVAAPVTFSILTTVAAFLPMFFMPGFTGKIFKVVPAVVVSVLVISLVESLFVLPAHLSHERGRGGINRLFAVIDLLPQAVGRGLRWFIEAIYRPVVEAATRWRYLSIALGMATLLVSLGFVAGGRIEFTFLPKIEADLVTADIELPFGVNKARTVEVQAQLVEAARELVDEWGGAAVGRGIATQLGSQLGRPGRSPTAKASSGGHIGSVQVRLVSSGERDFTAFAFADAWRERVGALPGVKTLTFSAQTGPSGGPALEVQLRHRDVGVLEHAAADLAGTLREFNGTKDIDDGYAAGKPQLDFKIKPAAQAMGLTAASLGRQVRGAFYGLEALRQQRGRDEVRVMVRFPEADRRSEFNVESLLLRTPGGGELPLGEAAVVERGVSYTSILRVDGRRSLRVTADVEKGVTTGAQVQERLLAGPLPELAERYPGLSYSFEGDNRSRNEALQVLWVGMLLALVGIYGLLAIPFGSYVQPAIVMSAIPFGFVGAIAGHALMGYELSVVSMMGFVALTGVVVNDSLVLIDAANRLRLDGLGPFEAIIQAGCRRLRPILLTSLTTFFGLMPMITETSLQARFLIPMALSLGFGVLFATFIILLLVPALYMVIEDLRWIYLGDEALTPHLATPPAPPEPAVGSGPPLAPAVKLEVGRGG